MDVYIHGEKQASPKWMMRDNSGIYIWLTGVNMSGRFIMPLYKIHIWKSTTLNIWIGHLAITIGRGIHIRRI